MNRVVTVERVVPAPAAEVFAVLADAGRHPEIDGSGALRAAAATPLALGTRFVMPMRVLPRSARPTELLQVAMAIANRGRMTNTVVEFEQDRRIAWRNFGRHV